MINDVKGNHKRNHRLILRVLCAPPLAGLVLIRFDASQRVSRTVTNPPHVVVDHLRLLKCPNTDTGVLNWWLTGLLPVSRRYRVF